MYAYLKILPYIKDGMVASPSKILHSIPEKKKKEIFSNRRHVKQSDIICGHVAALKRNNYIEERKGRYYILRKLNYVSK